MTGKSQDYINKIWKRFNNIDRSYDIFIRKIHDKCLTKVFERCNIVDNFSSSFAPNVNIIAKWKYWYVQLLLEYRFSNSNVKVCTIVFKMSTKESETKKCEREIIFRLHEDGKSYNEIAGIVNRSKSTIHYIIKKSKNVGTLANKARSGRPKKLTERKKKVIIHELKNNSTIAAPQLASMVADMFHKEVHPELYRRILRNYDFHGRVPRKKPYINAVNHKKWLAFVKTYINKDNSFWDKSTFRSSQSLTFLTQMVKIMCGENQIRNWKCNIYIKQWNTEVARSWCGGARLPVAPEIWYLLMEYLINISI